MVLTTQQLKEQEDLKELKAFKATPLNPKVLHSMGDLGVPRVAKKELTEFKEFNLSYSSRKRKTSQSRVNHEEVTTPFKARPFNASMFARDPRSEVRRLSMSERRLSVSSTSSSGSSSNAPRLLTSARKTSATSRRRVVTEAGEKESFSQFKARPMPDYRKMRRGTPQKTPVKTKTPTQFVPFNLATETRREMAQTIRQEQLERERQEEERQRKFKASKIRTYSMTGTAHVTVKRNTVPKGFELASTIRSEMAKQRFEEAQQRRLDDEKKGFNSFKARSAKVLLKQPFSARKSTKQLTEHSEKKMASEIRREQRLAYEAQQREKRQVEEEKLRLDKLQKQKEEAEELKAFRKTLSYKAKPIMGPTPVKIKRSKNPLTEAKSPLLMTKIRSAAQTPRN